MAPRRRCPTCGSRQWHKEPSSGLIACSEGHVLQNYRNEAAETEEMGPHALRKRTLKSGRKKKEAGSKANPLLYHGARGRYHYFECLQLLLRKQVATLIQLWALPPEFETICRDIWALHLDLLPDPPTAEPWHFAQDLRNEDEKQQAGGDKSDGESDDDERQSDDEDEDDERKAHEEDPELAELLRANSDLEESSDSGGEDDGPPKQKVNFRRRKRGRHVYEGPASTIAVLIVGCWTLRVPIICHDLTRLIESYELPYLDPVERQLIPRSMVKHLTKHNVQALSPYHAPKTQVLHGLASRLAKRMDTMYGIHTPEANAAPILWRVVSQGLGATRILTKRVGQILSLPLTLNYTLAPGLKKRRTYDPERHVYDNVAPEVSLMGAAIVVLKMVYGLDGRKRTPGDEADVACAMGEIDGFLRTMREESGTDIWMSEEMIDVYLELSERVLIGGEVQGKAVLEQFFPFGGVGIDAGEKSKGGARQRLEAIVADQEGMRPGEGYRVYRARDVGGGVSVEWESVLKRGAEWTGVSVDLLAAVVESFDHRIIRWRPRPADVIAWPSK
ncbi:hypothetical protein H0H92_004071 [Tricholoma furcatifolium]|nr:hypothetical protein H0H92_004071 [Tricholoma furcatifolium]